MPGVGALTGVALCQEPLGGAGPESLVRSIQLGPLIRGTLQAPPPGLSHSESEQPWPFANVRLLAWLAPLQPPSLRSSLNTGRKAAWENKGAVQCPVP